MAEPIPLRCEKCGGLIQADLVAIETSGTLTCPYCGADFAVPLPPGGFGVVWFEAKYRIKLNPLQKIAITWLKRSGRIDRFAGGNWLRLTDDEISDRHCRHIGCLSFLRELDLRSNDITDAGIVELSGLTGVAELELGGNDLTDKALPSLAGLTNLTTLDMEGAGKWLFDVRAAARDFQSMDSP